ncbi:hypothetical protein HWB51_gp083 [Mycobacterium phage Cuke]|uniref:Uncharacterized protein n=1 Tax=Mycobacterium phage Cuke TaxID=2079417 RepID=A0A2L1IX14_9CAUD|nr:hypothetical protein HWB51_gp083 [Mycobacterium phage Cuke]AVD99729.1 hypothetical protein SEA_CUKE_113 [Mycobacterium phage Cuke]
MRVEIEFESNESGRIRVDLESEKASNATVFMQTAFMTIENELNSLHAQSYGG